MKNGAITEASGRDIPIDKRSMELKIKNTTNIDKIHLTTTNGININPSKLFIKKLHLMFYGFFIFI